MGFLDLFQRSQPQPRAEPPRKKGGVLGYLRDWLGGWPGPQNARGTPAEHDLERERISQGPNGIIMPWFLPWHDDRTGETVEMRRAYRRMIAECNVKAALCGKLWGVASLDLQIIPASKDYRDGEIADFVQYALTDRLSGGIPELAWSILSGGLVDGYSICEKVWQPEDQGDYAGKIVLDQLKPKMVDDDVILRVDDKRNVTSIMGLRYNAGMEWDPRLFVLFKHMSFYSSPVGQSDLRAAYRPYLLLDTAEKLRGIAIEKRAIPMLVAHYMTSSQKPTLETALARAKSQTWLALPENVKFEAINIAGSADTIFRDAAKDWKHDCFLAIQGAILQQLEGTVAEGRGNSKVHKSTADLFKWVLSYGLQTIINRDIVKDLVGLNYATGKYPKVLLSAVDVAELAQEMAIDTGLSKLGMVLSKEDLRERYGRKPPLSKDDALQPPAPAGGGAPGASGPAPPPDPLQQVQQEQRRDTKDYGDAQPATGVAGSPFRFSEGWNKWLRNGTTRS